MTGVATLPTQVMARTPTTIADLRVLRQTAIHDNIPRRMAQSTFRQETARLWHRLRQDNAPLLLVATAGRERFVLLI